MDSNGGGGLRRSRNSSTSPHDAAKPDDKHKTALIKIAQIGGTTMTYERPDIQLLYAVHAPGNQTISKPSDETVGMSLRARESKEFNHSNARGDLNLSAVSKQVALPRSARQAHWVSRDSGGKAIKGYVKEGVSRVLQNNCKLQTQPKKRRKELPRAPRSKLHLINLRSTLPRAAHRASNTPKVGKGNGVDITGWLVSPSVRSTYIGDGAVLFNVKEGLCYSLDGVAAHVWVTIEGSPSGISFEGIVDVLETHSTVSREELESAARDCVGALRREGLVQPRDASLRHSSMREGQTVISEQPLVQRLDTVESLVDQLFPQRVESNMDWRAKKMKDLIDLNPAKIHDSLGDVCSQLRLSLSDRQARRLFKESAGISMKEYARKRCLVFAARQLQNTDDPIKVIATDAGYRTLQGFEKGFYGLFRLTPVEFRRMWHRSQVTA